MAAAVSPVSVINLNSRTPMNTAPAERRSSNEFSEHLPTTTQGGVGLGVDDVVIFPLVLLALVAEKLLQATLSIVIHVLDYAFPIMLQVMRFPLFTVRIIGDALAALIECVIRYLPIPLTNRDALRELVNRHWSRLRQKISYRAFEEALHRTFEAAMRWIFLTCRGLTPGGALLVIVGAVLWLPLSFIAATAMHAALIVQAAALPAWMQLLHPLATFIAKSKLLVLPTYPAAWPQAKRHHFVQALFQFYLYIASLPLIRKMGYRYRQVEYAAAVAADCLKRVASFLGLTSLFNILLAGLKSLLARIGTASRTVMMRRVEEVSRVPLLGSIVVSYAARYKSSDQRKAAKPSEKIRKLFERWSIKFSIEHYEAKEEETAKVA
jgi:hypothetical protein